MDIIIIIQGNRNKPDVIPCFIQDGFFTVRIVKLDGRSAKKPPSSRRLRGVNAGLGAANSNTSFWNLRPWIGKARHGNAGIHAAQIRKSRQKSQHIDPVILPAVNGNDLISGKTGELFPVMEINAETGTVADGNLKNPFQGGAAADSSLCKCSYFLT